MNINDTPKVKSKIQSKGKRIKERKLIDFIIGLKRLLYVLYPNCVENKR